MPMLYLEGAQEHSMIPSTAYAQQRGSRAQGYTELHATRLGSPLDVTAIRLDEDPKATSTGVDVMLCFMNGMFLALTSVSLNSLMTLSSQAVARAEPSALKASPPTWSVCPCSDWAAFKGLRQVSKLTTWKCTMDEHLNVLKTCAVYKIMRWSLPIQHLQLARGKAWCGNSMFESWIVFVA